MSVFHTSNRSITSLSWWTAKNWNWPKRKREQPRKAMKMRNGHPCHISGPLTHITTQLATRDSPISLLSAKGTGEYTTETLNVAPFCFESVYLSKHFVQASPSSFRRETSCKREASSVHTHSHDAPTGTYGRPQFKCGIPGQLPAKGRRLCAARCHHHWYRPLSCNVLLRVSSVFLHDIISLLCRYCDPRFQQQHGCPSPDRCRREYSRYQRIQRYLSFRKLLRAFAVHWVLVRFIHFIFCHLHCRHVHQDQWWEDICHPLWKAKTIGRRSHSFKRCANLLICFISLWQNWSNFIDF